MTGNFGLFDAMSCFTHSREVTVPYNSASTAHGHENPACYRNTSFDVANMDRKTTELLHIMCSAALEMCYSHAVARLRLYTL